MGRNRMTLNPLVLVRRAQARDYIRAVLERQDAERARAQANEHVARVIVNH